MMERERAASNREKPKPADEQPARSGETAVPSPAQTQSNLATPMSTRRGELTGARIWVLPTTEGEWWAVTPETNDTALAHELRADPPILFTPRLEAQEDQTALNSARRWIRERLLVQANETAFLLARNTILGIAWLAAALVAMRFPGEFRLLGTILAPLGAGFLAYTILRYGRGVLNWHNWRIEADNAFIGKPKVLESPLLTYVAKALELRKKLQQHEQGAAPDEELLDANAYRKLIKDGVCTAHELIQLGKAIEFALKLDEARKTNKKISDIAREAHIDTDTAIFYRDLAAAAAEINLDEEYASIRF